MNVATPEKASILIVDDMEENLVALEAVLGSLDQELVRAHSGEEALKAMLRQEFAVVLLDVLMPGMDGFETAANIKRLDQTKDVPIILVTGNEADTDYLYRGYALGAADFLTKPFDPWLLRTKVNVFLDLYRKNRQLAAQAEQLRRLLVGAPTPAAAIGPAGSVERIEDARNRLSRVRAAGTAAGAGSGEQLSEITERLAQIELQLRDAVGNEAPDLADRIADLERAVRSLRVGRDA
ncbi:response regulator [Streptomyces sp. NBC_00316]|uniref:response regulator n=1 Tax=Streptomyces sp. NBC_00316 TaxID=2975710 RepID=UPI002E2882DF|nr:response regulator [Streptomyces sp. NBC_00316]